jgi:type VI secretion system protein
MVQARSLLERLRQPAGIDQRTAQFDRRLLVASIAANLRQILNARHGSALAQMDLGIPAPCEIVLAFPHAVNHLRGIIVDVITKYEPRLVDVQAYYQPRETENLVMDFLISARLRHDGGQITFETHFDRAGLIHLDA